MDPINESILMETRRQLLARGARGLGSLALYTLLQKHAAAATEKKADWRIARSSALCTEGEARHLPAHAGSASAARNLRL